MTEKENKRASEILGMLKSDMAYPELILVNPRDSWRFVRKIPPHKFGCILDNDDNLTMAGKENRSWIMLQAALRAMGNTAMADEIESLRLFYRKIEDADGPLSAEQMHKWHRENLRMFIEGGLTLEALERQVQKDAKMYPEAVDLLKYLLDKGSTVCVVSAGIADIIRLSFKKHGIDPAKYHNLKIFAIGLIFDEDGPLTGYYPHTIITLEDKSPHARNFMLQRGIMDENVIAMGDGLTDAQMINTFNSKTSMVLFCPAHKIGDLKESSFAQMSGSVHAVIKKDFGIFTAKIKEMTS